MLKKEGMNLADFFLENKLNSQCLATLPSLLTADAVNQP
jgi:hypothetical protein